jgi:arsenate reductase
MAKKVLVLCTGNSCRSIIAEALINRTFDGKIAAYSSGVSASGMVNPSAKKILQSKGIWRDHYHSKPIKDLEQIEFDLVITVCENASQTCPVFPGNTPVTHIGFDDPDGKEYEAFELCFEEIKSKLLPFINDYSFNNLSGLKNIQLQKN